MRRRELLTNNGRKKYYSQYFTIVMNEAGNLKCYNNNGYAIVKYSLDGGVTWTQRSSSKQRVSLDIAKNLSAGQKVCFAKPSSLNITTTKTTQFFTDGAKFSAEGNVMSLLYDNFANADDLTGCVSGVLSYLFVPPSGNTNNLVNIDGLILPATTLAASCYSYMFAFCTGLTSIPNDLLPATTLASQCYQYMFYGCTGLTSIPNGLLPATTLGASCYYGMFYGCTGLTSIPNGLLPATTLLDGCYAEMFYGCTGLTTVPSNLLPCNSYISREAYAGMFCGCNKLTTAPDLPCPYIGDSAYAGMFYGCTKLNYVKCMAIDFSEPYCTTDWLKNVASSGKFYQKTGITWTRGVDGIPNNWTIYYLN